MPRRPHPRPHRRPHRRPHPHPRPLFSSALLLLCGAVFSSGARAQSGVSPEAAPAAPEATSPQINPAGPQTEVTPVQPAPATPPETDANSTDASATEASATGANARPRLEAENVSYDGITATASGTPAKPVKFSSAAGLITAQQVTLNIQTQQLAASGDVQFERERTVARKALRAGRLNSRSNLQTVRETAFGQNLDYNFRTGQGTLDNAKLRLATFSLTTGNLVINGQKYTASNVVLRPGGLSEAEEKIYGTPPFSLHARTVTAFPIERRGQMRQRVRVSGAGLYFKGTRILPVPSYSFSPGGGDNNGDGRITPGVSLNSADRFLVTTRFNFPINKTEPSKLSANADVGLSARVGLRGGVGLSSTNDVGRFTLNFRRSDVVSTQLTNRIELDRKPELSYYSPALLTFNVGKQRAGLAFDGSLGDFTERFIGGNRSASSTRARARLVLSTRLQPGPGAFARAFSAYSSYGSGGNYRNTGVELGYDGQLLRRLNGQVSLRLTSLSGQTPFRFDRVEIRRELRATVDYALSPRYIVPLDLRYDLQRGSLRDATFGLLRSYKTFAYGVTFQTARRDLRLEVREGF